MSESSSLPETNPLREALPRTRVPDPCAVVLFGATGDLAHRKLVPALFQLARGGNLPSEYAIVGFASRDWTDDDLRAAYEKSLSKSGGADFHEVWPQFANRIFFSPGTFDDPASYQKLKADSRSRRQDARHTGQPGLLPGGRSRVFRHDHQGLRRSGPDLSAAPRPSLEPRRYRKAVWP